MKCPTCAQNTPDEWEGFAARPHFPLGEAREVLTDPGGGDSPRATHATQFDWMYCANKACGQLVVRGHDTYMKEVAGDSQVQTTDTWLVHPRRASRPLDPLIPANVEALAGDFAEAVAILDISPRMAAVLARSILADLLEDYAGLADFRLVDRVNGFVDDTNRPYDLREDLHYLREIADLSAHTKKDKSDQLEKIEISHEEAEWTLSVIERLFDYFIVSPSRSATLREGIDAKLKAAGRKAIKPLQADSELPSDPDG
jgi:hypothetical protein